MIQLHKDFCEKIPKDKKLVCVLGLGNIGKCISYGLIKLGYDVIGYDALKENMDKTSELCGDKFTTPSKSYPSLEEMIFDLSEKVELVVSALPYHLNYDIAKCCIDLGLHYVDLGGNVRVSQYINDYAKDNAKEQIFSDIGLAPGWVNIIAEECYNQLSKHGVVENIEMSVGGIPQIKPNNLLGYYCNWSTEGLINEYIDKCVSLEDGELICRDGMSVVEDISIETEFETIDLERFNTSGGISHTAQSMKDKGVKNCAYYTIRYRGHAFTFLHLINNVNINNIINIIKNKNYYKDAVIIHVYGESGDVFYDKLIIKLCTDKFSAMQMCTAFPVCSIIDLMINKHMNPNQKVLNYSHVPYTQFNNILERLFEEENVQST